METESYKNQIRQQPPTSLFNFKARGAPCACSDNFLVLQSTQQTFDPKPDTTRSKVEGDKLDKVIALLDHHDD